MQTLVQMSRDRAKWDDRKLSLMLDLVAKLKELCHWADKGPTSIGRTTIYHPFNELKRVYFNWRDGHKHTGLGRDPETDEVAVDPIWCAAVHGVLASTLSFNPRKYEGSH